MEGGKIEMKTKEVRKFIGKKVYLVLRNNFRYTAEIPDFDGDSFSIIDKFDKEYLINCEFVSYITEAQSPFQSWKGENGIKE